MNVAAYVRVSTQRQAQAQTIEQQLERLRAHSHAQGWQLADEHVFRDDGYSGAQLARPGLDRLRDCVAQGAVGRILITSPDRLARNGVSANLLYGFERFILQNLISFPSCSGAITSIVLPENSAVSCPHSVRI